MKAQQTNNKLSDEMNVVILEVPTLLVRMGVGVTTAILMLFFFGTWVIKYPEVLKGNATITTNIAPIRVVVPTGGRMSRLIAKDGMMVKKGDILAETENTTKLGNIPVMKQLMIQTKTFLQNPQGNISFPKNDFVWGDLQDNFNVLHQNYLDLKRLHAENFQAVQVRNLATQQEDLRKIVQLNEHQKEFKKEEFENSEQRFLKDEKLYKDGVYSNAEYVERKNKHLEKRSELEEFYKETIDNELKINKLKALSQEVSHEYSVKRNQYLDNIQLSLSNIENSLQNWQQNYLITAPADGKLVFLKKLTENEYLKEDDVLFSVMPENENFIATVDIPVRGMGKASVGQKVIIKLYDYPYQEFGMLEGKVQSLDPSLNVKFYRVMVSLPKGLQSTYKHNFTFKTEMIGSAEIVTADLRLIERVFYGFRKLLM